MKKPSLERKTVRAPDASIIARIKTGDHEGKLFMFSASHHCANLNAWRGADIWRKKAQKYLDPVGVTIDGNENDQELSFYDGGFGLPVDHGSRMLSISVLDNKKQEVYKQKNRSPLGKWFDQTWLAKLFRENISGIPVHRMDRQFLEQIEQALIYRGIIDEITRVRREL